jgi:large subunit ribosomal protein L10
MKQEQKVTCTAELEKRFSTATVVVLTEYRGLAAGQLDRLRREVRAAEGLYKVAKNTLARRAVGAVRATALGKMLKGPTALVFGFRDPVVVAKVIVRFAKDHETLTIKGGVLDDQVLTAEGIKELSELPGREELLGRLLALLQAPATRLLRTLQQPAAQVVQLVEAIRRRQAEGAPVEGAPTENPPKGGAPAVGA